MDTKKKTGRKATPKAAPKAAPAPEMLDDAPTISSAALKALGFATVGTLALAVQAAPALAAATLRGVGLSVKGIGTAIRATGAGIDAGGVGCWKGVKKIDALAATATAGIARKAAELNARQREAELAKAKTAEPTGPIAPAAAPA